MIKIDFPEPDTETWKAWRLKCDKEQKLLNNAIESGKSAKVKVEVYKELKEEIYMYIDGPFHGKCAYCETRIRGDQYGDMEHFRPKARVYDYFTELPLTRILNGETINHPGYYWLAYDWKNLLPSCEMCNRPSPTNRFEKRYGKKNFFPVEGFQAWEPGEETKEQPLLINPTVDNPKDHLMIDHLGIFHALNKKGQTCIDIFGLNDRDLPDSRRDMYDKVMSKLKVVIFEARGSRKKADHLINKLKQMQKGIPHRPHTAAITKAIEDFKIKYSPYLSFE